MTGVILCGGQSSRMGTDKGLLPLQANTWAKDAANKLAALSIPVLVAVNAQQYDQYKKIFPVNQLLKDNETLSVKGPLHGILSAHLLMPAEDLLVIACDMPLMPLTLLVQLCEQYKMGRSAAYVFSHKDGVEPLCGIYTATGLSQILQLLRSSQLGKYSMKHALEQLTITAIPIAAEQEKYFRNFNTPADVQDL